MPNKNIHSLCGKSQGSCQCLVATAFLLSLAATLFLSAWWFVTGR